MVNPLVLSHNIIISRMKKQQYISPGLTVMEFRSERSYAISQLTPSNDMLELLFQEENNRETETFIVRDGWADNEQNSFWI